MVKETLTPRKPSYADPMSAAKVAKSLENAGISLSERHAKMLYCYTTGMSKADACEAVGLPATSSWSVFNQPKMLQAIAVVLERVLQVEAAPASIRYLYRVVEDDKVAAGSRIQAASRLLDMAGYTAKRMDRNDKPQGDITTFTSDQLREQIARLEAEMKDVTPDDKPVSKPMDDDAIDFA